MRQITTFRFQTFKTLQKKYSITFGFLRLRIVLGYRYRPRRRIQETGVLQFGYLSFRYLKPSGSGHFFVVSGKNLIVTTRRRLFVVELKRVKHMLSLATVAEKKTHPSRPEARF